jgi:hypothetical protein
MLTSLKVVRMAFVDCDCTRRSATRARRRDIGTRCSGRSPRLDMGGAATGGNGRAAGTGAAGAVAAGAAGRAGAPAAMAPSTSPLVTRPSLPVPPTEPWASWLSAISLAAAGIATPALAPPAVGPAVGAGGAASAAAVGAAAGAAPAWASVSMVAMTWSLTTVPPAATTCAVITPLTGAGTSSTTLSVSISMMISSIVTTSPGCFFHCSSVASATDSDNWGTLTSTIAMMFLYRYGNARAGPTSRVAQTGIHTAKWQAPRHAGCPGNHLVSTKPLSLA